MGLARLRTRTHGHANRARLIGRRVRGIDAVVIDNPERAAYCAAGRPHAVVITTAALAALDDRQVQAVLAHERAHLAGHHAQILAVLRVLAASMPGITLFTAGAVEVGRLLEMCADDSAARVHGSRAGSRDCSRYALRPRFPTGPSAPAISPCWTGPGDWRHRRGGPRRCGYAC
ncbi:Peptidase M48, Ste24p precursor (plasmid) [Rhodococcus sp. WAY2]|nr:Peptidase M48, Ste24p precursor [Rhodococcus sp. WAY2]